MSRRAFLKFGVAVTGVLALPVGYAPRITAALSAAPRIPLIWLHGQTCSGDSAAFLQASNPTVADLLVNTLSLEYDEALMAGAGGAADLSLAETLSSFPNGYVAVIEGAIPIAADGIYCTVGGRAFLDVVKELAAGAKGVIAVGSCAFDGGAPAAAGGPTGAVGAVQVVDSSNLVALPGCPVNVDNLAATMVHYLTFGEFPATDGRRRPLFAYGGLIHNQCERRAHYEFGEFVLAWGDEAAQKGWCLYKMGCKGPEAIGNCPTVKYAEGASWNVLAGHGCIGCTMPAFWNAMGGAYERLPPPLPFAPNLTADQLGLALVGAVGGLAVAHGTASVARQRRRRGAEQRALPEATAVSDEQPAEPQLVAEAPSEVAEVEVAEVEVAEVEVAAPPKPSAEPEPAELLDRELVEGRGHQVAEPESRRPHVAPSSDENVAEPGQVPDELEGAR